MHLCKWASLLKHTCVDQGCLKKTELSFVSKIRVISLRKTLYKGMQGFQDLMWLGRFFFFWLF